MAAATVHRAIVTGGTSGIGAAVARLLAREGAAVAVVGRSLERGTLVVESLAPAGATHCFVECDLDCGGEEQGQNVQVALAAAMEGWKGLHPTILVNSAGTCYDAPLLTLPDAELDAMWRVNTRGAVLWSRAATRAMLRARRQAQGDDLGSVVNVGSVVGLTAGSRGQVGYSVSKAALLGLTTSLAAELGPRGIRVNQVNPGFIQTSLTEHLAHAHDKMANLAALRRVGQPEDVAEAVLFLVKCRFAHGSVVTVDGGLNMLHT